MEVARRCLVDDGLKNTGVEHGRTSDEETNCDACYGREYEVQSGSDEGVDDAIYKWDQNDNRDWVDIEEDIIWQAMKLHLASYC